jgi:hypothetical protein
VSRQITLTLSPSPFREEFLFLSKEPKGGKAKGPEGELQIQDDIILNRVSN